MKIRPWMMQTIMAAMALLIVVLILVVSNLSRIISEQHSRLTTLNGNHAVLSVSENLQRLRREAFTRAALYDEIIKKQMLLDGMIVNRDGNGNPEAICDSLLFSSIRFYALSTMGFSKSAKDAWSAIGASRNGSQWIRHPRCKKSLSRDMIMGVMVALRANPDDGTSLFRSMLSEIDRNGGFVGDGPFYVSWLSPGIAGLLRMEAERRKVPFDEWPWILKQSFSSIEFDAMFLGEGYVSHLAALGLWLESTQSKSSLGFNPRSFFGAIERLVRMDRGLETSLDIQRRQWIADRLRSLHSGNLFYRWLDHDAFGTLTPETEEQMLTQLLSMSQFPVNRLPMNCDRHADYLWQRKQAEFALADKDCSTTFNGVDFLWMASLLGVGKGSVEEPETNPQRAPVAH